MLSEEGMKYVEERIEKHRERLSDAAPELHDEKWESFSNGMIGLINILLDRTEKQLRSHQIESNAFTLQELTLCRVVLLNTALEYSADGDFAQANDCLWLSKKILRIVQTRNESDSQRKQ